MSEKTKAVPDTPPRAVPPVALLLSLVALWVPVVASGFIPEWLGREVGMLPWLLALLPAFLLSYYRGWRGASVALAGFMAALSLSQVVVNWVGGEAPNFEIVFIIVSVAIVVSLGAGFLSEAFKRSLQKAEKSAMTDVLTGLPNRRMILLYLDRKFAAARRGARLSVVLFDLDRFKSINDRFGHAGGDEILQSFAEVLHRNTRAMDISGRFGGEEFLTVLEGSNKEAARLFAERVRRQCAEIDFQGFQPTVSAGVASFEPGMASPDVMVAAADHALYRAKENGRDRVVASGDARPDREPPDESDPKSTPTGRANAAQARILIVDDESRSRRSVARSLRTLGYSVLEASSGDAALKVIGGLEEAVDLVLTDVMMPEMSGFRLVDHLTRQAPHLAVVYMSGYAQDLPVWSGAPGRAVKMLEKPFSTVQLEATIEQALQQERDGGSPAKAVPDLQSVEPADDIVVLARSPEAVLPHCLAVTERCGTHVRGTRALPNPRIQRDEWLNLGILILDCLELGESWYSPLREDLARGCGPRAIFLLNPSSLAAEALGSADDVLVIPAPSDPELLAEQVAAIRRVTLFFAGTERRIRTLQSQLQARTALLDESLTGALNRLARAAEFRDDVTGEHANRVGLIAGLLATSLGLDPEQVDLIEKAAPLHDIGKLAIPDTILHKPGPLTPVEREVMQRHTTVGAELLRGREPLFQVAAEVALRHHEQWDGGGYPDGLAGEEIPIAARIVAVADVWDSLSNERPYRKALPRDEALGIVVDLAGKALEPRIVALFEELLAEGRLEDLDYVAHPEQSGPIHTGA